MGRAPPIYTSLAPDDGDNEEHISFADLRSHFMDLPRILCALVEPMTQPLVAAVKSALNMSIVALKKWFDAKTAMEAEMREAVDLLNGRLASCPMEPMFGAWKEEISFDLASIEREGSNQEILMLLSLATGPTEVEQHLDTFEQKFKLINFDTDVGSMLPKIRYSLPQVVSFAGKVYPDEKVDRATRLLSITDSNNGWANNHLSPEHQAMVMAMTMCRSLASATAHLESSGTDDGAASEFDPAKINKKSPWLSTYAVLIVKAKSSIDDFPDDSEAVALKCKLTATCERAESILHQVGLHMLNTLKTETEPLFTKLDGFKGDWLAGLPVSKRKTWNTFFENATTTLLQDKSMAGMKRDLETLQKARSRWPL